MSRIHPYYIAKTKDIFRQMKFDNDADPCEIAAWAQSETPRGEFCFTTSDGHIVGYGRYKRRRLTTVGYADDDTTRKYGLLRNEAGMACCEIASKIGRPVVIVKRSLF